jgi:protein farnesyltransferase/geranylgeranyltransferase type-1 subunit alpha
VRTVVAQRMTLYASRADWSDVVPVEQDDGPNPACPIAYTDDFKDCMNYFRAIIRSQEMSQRVFDLTSDVISANAANYTVWYHRRKLLDALKLDVRAELNFTTDTIVENPKNYQVWHHRRELVLRLNDPSKEMQFTAEIIQDDAKNYHAWQHRHWAITTFNMSASLGVHGMPYADRLIEDDSRNNSAWNYRFFLLSQSPLTADTVAAEVENALGCLRLTPNNESCANYLRGIVTQHGGLGKFPSIAGALSPICAELQPAPTALSLLMEYHLALKTEEGNTNARTLCDTLLRVDDVRRKYWAFRREQI